MNRKRAHRPASSIGRLICRLSAALLLAAIIFAVPVQAQLTEPPPRIEQAEATFEQGLDAFEAGDYGMAYRRFRLVYMEYPLNRQTTAAVLMAGKALYRSGEYTQAVDLLSDFLEQFPTSSYLGEARTTRDLAQRQLDRQGQSAREIRLGIALPLNPEDAAFTQALFNGVRLAVDDFNAGHRDVQVRMVFEDTGNDPSRARQAVMQLAREGNADVVIGPLFSREAQAAAEAAEREGIVLVAPLATDEGIVDGRRYVFQANPSISTRGRVMARYAVRDLRMASFGVIAERASDGISEQMAEGFQDEALRLGAETVFFEILPHSRAWSNLTQYVGRDTLAQAEAIYLPVDGRTAAQQAESALRILEQEGIRARVLGNTRWDGLSNAGLASRLGAIYANDFYVHADNPDVTAFRRDYRALAEEVPDRLAYVGYDVTRYLLDHLMSAPGRPLNEILPAAPLYEGLGTRIDFQGGHVNQAMYFLGYRDGGTVLLW